MSIVGAIPFGNPQPWTDMARCKETGPDDATWFPDKFSRGLDAKRICGSCDVRAQCLKYAMDNRVTSGIWGGLSPREREVLRRQRRPKQPFHRQGCPCAVCRRPA